MEAHRTFDEIESSDVFVQSLKESLVNDYISCWNHWKTLFRKIKQLEIKPGLSVLMYVFLIYLFIHVCNIPQCYVAILLSIIGLGLNIPNNVYQIFPMTFDKLSNVINLYKTEESKRITFCRKQMQYYSEQEVKRRKWRVNSKNFIGWFYFYDIEQVLSLKFDDSNYRASLLRGITHIVHLLKNTSAQQVADINSGRVIRKLREPGQLLSSFLCQPFMLFLDGVALFKSGTDSIIPIYAINLNLPAEERYNMENLLLIGIMSTKACSSFHHYLQYAVKIVNKLCEIGYTVTVANKRFRIRALVVTFAVDIKAKDECLAMKQGGFYRCCYSYHPGVSINGTVAYPFQGTSYDLRSNQSYLFDSFVITKYAPLFKPKATSFRGIKAEAPLLKLKNFQCPRYFPVDALHVFDHGIIKLFVTAWLGKRTTRLLHHRYQHLNTLPWVLPKKQIDDIERDINNLRLPDQLSRRVRCLKDYKYWKGDEYRVFALYVSLPLLVNRLPMALWLH